ncbi:LOW QUALITY PROTEIN: probable N-acetyltransferase 16 [Montipora capricornis]|uniref:LOW QUALITY PROTEIN: probable N-acetyltransferase 16 n=1 Tax=Montipora capricornis TaxID=246305 RepID=UPI0035F1A882
MSQDLNIRLARPSDYDKILTLSEGIYDGYDYLPARYHTWMAMKNLHVMLAFSGDKLASLVAGSVIDEGKTLLTRARRTLPELQGQGINKLLTQALIDLVRKQHPVIQRSRFVSRVKPEMAKKGYDTILMKDILSCVVACSTQRSQQIVDIDSVQIQTCTKEYICDVIFRSFSTRKRSLFPSNVIIADWFPFEPSRSNIDYLNQENDLVYFAVEKCAGGLSRKSFSIGVRSQCVKFPKCSVTIYSNDPLLHQAHLVHHFKRSCEDIEKEFAFTCWLDQRFTKSARKLLNQLLPIKSDEGIDLTTAYLNQSTF